MAAALQTTLTVLKTTALVALILIGLAVARHGAAAVANFGAGLWPIGGLHWSNAAGIWGSDQW